MPKHVWPDDGAVVAGIAQHGSKAAYARALGVSATALKDHIDRHGIVPQQAAQPLTAASVGEPVSREEMLEQQLVEARKALLQARAEDVREARVLEVLEGSISRVVPTYKPRPRRTSVDHEAHTLCLLWSDCHASEVVSLTETLGLNEYNWPIMMERLRRLAEGVRSHRDHYGAKARKLVIASLGDQLTGVIHEELRDTNDTTFSDSMVRFGEEGAQWISQEFGDVFEEIEVHVIPGNHPRFSQKPRHKLSYDNGDYVAGHIMRIALAGHPNIRVNVPRASKAIIDICGRKVLLLHGDGVRSTMVGVPWGGIIRHSERLVKLFDLADVEVQHVFGGHWHNPQVAEDFSILINGSIKGVDEYGIDKFAGGKPPVQLLAAFHPRHGITGVHKIDCREGAQAAGLRLAA